MVQKILVYVLLILMLIISCDLNIPPDLQSESWIAMIDADGNNLQFICADWKTPYWIPDPDNPEEEIIMLGRGDIELMNPDGSNRRTIIDSAGSIYRVSEDRSKMLLVNDGDIYIANTDGSGFENITNTPDYNEKEPSYSLNNDKVLYRYNNVQDSIIIIACRELSSTITYNIFEEEYIYWSYFISPVYINDDTVIFGQSYSNLDTLNTEGLYLFNGENKILIDPGFINGKITYNRNNNLIAYRNDILLKLYHTDSGIIEIIEGNYSYNVSACFNRDGNLLTYTSFVIDTSTLEGYNILQFYGDYANIDSNPIDFDKTSSKVVMRVNRIFPNSNEE